MLSRFIDRCNIWDTSYKTAPLAAFLGLRARVLACLSLAAEQPATVPEITAAYGVSGTD